MKLKELLSVVDEIKKDLSYTRNFQEKWQRERRRFPILYEYIGKQVEFFREKIRALLDVEVKEESVDEYLRWRLQSSGKRKGEREEESVVELQTLEAAAAEAAKLRQQKEAEDAKKLAAKVRQTVKQHIPEGVKDADKLAELGSQVADEIEKGEKKK